MNAKCSSPSPSEPSPLDNAVAANMEMEVDNGTEVASEKLDKKKMTSLPQPIFANYNELLTAETAGSQFSSTMPNTPNLEKTPVVNRPGTVRQKKRPKLFVNGYFMCLDKVSCNGTKTFWRCEYKKTCKARLHTPMNTGEHVQFLNEHNHRKAPDEEVKLYGLDPSAIVRNKIYKIDNIADLGERRQIRKRIALKEAAAAAALLEQRKQMAAASANNAMDQAETRLQLIRNVETEMPGSAQVTPNRNSQELNPSSSSLPSAPALSIASSCSTEAPKKEMSYSIRKEVLERIERSIQNIGVPKPSRYPRTTTNPTIHFEFYIAKDDGMDEHQYIFMRIDYRDENLLKEALEYFCGEKCIGILIFGVSPKIDVILNQLMLRGWENNQFFLLDISNPSSWRLQYVDHQTGRDPIAK